MTIQWADDFTRYGTGSASNTAMRDGLPYNNWAAQCVADPDPIAAATGSRCVQVYNGLSNNPLENGRIALPNPTADEVGVCARYWFPGFGDNNGRQVIAAWATVAPLALAYVHVEANGAITIADGDKVAIASTVAPVISTNTWNHIESSYNGTTGEIEVRLNGNTILTGASTDLGIVAFAMPMHRLGTTTDDIPFVKDLVIWDDSGATNNTFFGTVSCKRLKPNADVTLGGWVPSTGATGFNLLAKDAVNDATYVSAGDPPPAAADYGFENLPADITSVRGLVMVGRMRKVDGGDGNVQMSLISNGDAADGTDRPLTTVFSYWYDISQLDPDTGLPWTPLAVDNMNGRMNRTV